MLTGFNKLANNDIPNAVKPLQDAVNELNNNMVQIAINTGENLKNIVDTQNKLQTVIQKALFDEFGNVTLMKRFDETDQKLNKIDEFLAGTGIELGFNKTLNEKLDAIFKKAGTSPEEIANLNTSLSETQKSIKNINQNLAGLRLNVQSLTNTKETVDSSQVEALKNENFKLMGQVTLLNDEKLKLEQQVATITEKITRSSQDIQTLQVSLASAGEVANTQNREAQSKIINLMKEKTDEAAKNSEIIKRLQDTLKEEIEGSASLGQEVDELQTLLSIKQEKINEFGQGKGFNIILINALNELKKNERDIEGAKNFIKQMPLFGQLSQINKLTESLKNEMDRILNTATKELRKNNSDLDEVLTTKIQRRGIKEEGKVDIKEENKKKFFESKKQERLKAQNERRSQESGGDTIITEAPPQESTPTTFEAPTTPNITPTQETPVFQAAQSNPISESEQQKLERRLGFTEDDAKAIIDLREKSADIKAQLAETKVELAQLQKESVKLNKLIKAGIDVQANSQRLRRNTDRIGELTNQRTQLFSDRKEIKKNIDILQRQFLEEQGNRNRQQEETVQQVLNLDKIDKETKRLQRELKAKEFFKKKAEEQRMAKLNAIAINSAILKK